MGKKYLVSFSTQTIFHVLRRFEKGDICNAKRNQVVKQARSKGKASVFLGVATGRVSQALLCKTLSLPASRSVAAA